MFRTSSSVRQELIGEVLRVFDDGAEIRFFVGAQPTSPDETSGMWVASRPITTSTEASTVAGMPATFITTVAPAAAAYVAHSTAILNATTAEQDALTALTAVEASFTTLSGAHAAALSTAGATSYAVATNTSTVQLLTPLITSLRAELAASEATYAMMVGDVPMLTALAAAAEVNANAAIAAVDAIVGNVTYAQLVALGGLAMAAEVSIEHYAETASAKIAIAATKYATSESALAHMNAAREAWKMAMNGPEETNHYEVFLAAQGTWVDAANATQVAENAASSARNTLHNAAYNSAPVREEYAIASADFANYNESRAEAMRLRDTALVTRETTAAALAAAVAGAASVGATDLSALITAQKSAVDAQAASLLAAQTASPALLAADSAAQVALTSAVSALTPVAADRELKLSAYAAAVSALAAAQAADDGDVLGGGPLIAGIPESGWCKVVHPAYSSVFLTATYGPEGGSADFTVSPSETHPAFDITYPMTLTYPVA